MSRRLFLLLGLGSFAFNVFKQLLPGQGGDDEEGEPTFVFKVFGQTVVIDWAEIIIGDPVGSHVRITGGGVEIKQGVVVKGFWQTDGDFFLGSDISEPETTFFAVFANAQNYGDTSEAMGAGDLLIGNNATGEGNIFFDVSLNQWKFRSGGDSVAFVDADNVIFGGPSFNSDEDKVEINSVPIQFKEMSSTPADPSGAEIECNMYMKADKLIVQANDGGTIKYWYLDLTSTTDQRWTYTTTAP